MEFWSKQAPIQLEALKPWTPQRATFNESAETTSVPDTVLHSHPLDRADVASELDPAAAGHDGLIEDILIREGTPQDIEASLDRLESQFPDKLDLISGS